MARPAPYGQRPSYRDDRADAKQVSESSAPADRTGGASSHVIIQDKFTRLKSTRAMTSKPIDDSSSKLDSMPSQIGSEKQRRIALESPGQGEREGTSLAESTEVVRKFEVELERVRHQLQRIVEQYQSAFQEQEVSRAKLQETNEELRSTTEKLEASKEELQSLNEELRLLNEELNKKVEEISNANDDLRNLISSTDIATIFLDRFLRIKRYTPRFAEVFNVIETDIGRPLFDIGHRLQYENLQSDAEEVARQLRKVEREVSGPDGKTYIARLVPYRTANQIGGVVLSFIEITDRRRSEEALRQAHAELERRVDERTIQLVRANEELRKEITERQRAEELARESRERLEGIVDSAMDAIISTDAEQRILLFNQAAEQIFRCQASEAIGSHLRRFIPKRFRRAQAEHVGRVSQSGVPRRHIESVMGLRADEEEFPFEASISEVEINGRKLFTVILRDITNRIRAQAAIKMRTLQQQAVADLRRNALAGSDLSSLLSDAVAKVAEGLRVEFCSVLEFLPKRNALLLRAGVGWKEGWVATATIPAGGDSQAGFALLSKSIVVVEDLRTESRFRVASLLLEHGIISGTSVIIQGRDRAFGVLGAHSLQPRKYSEDDIHFLQAVANVLATAVERRDLERELVDISSREQLRIGHDLHDGLCQELAGIQYSADLIAKKLAPDIPAKAAIAKLADRVRDAIVQARNLARGLSLVSIESHGFMAALEELAASGQELFGIRCRFQCKCPVLIDDYTLATHLYRIAQEAIHNAVKHGRAKNVLVELSNAGGSLTLSIVDDGKGLMPDWAKEPGMGLSIMNYRTRVIGGTFSVGPNEPRGTKVICSFKL
jgi:PAS domain S-box-containing protein